MKFAVNDTVRLLVDAREEGLVKGAVGVIVCEYSQPHEAYEVEFCNERGETIAQIVLDADQMIAIR